MKYLLNTCSFIWFITEDSKLPQELRKLINSNDNVYVSYTTFWEIAIKQNKGKLSIITMNIYELAEICREYGIIILPLKLSYLERLKKLPFVHNDPFDRIIIAMAIEEDMTLLTKDSEIIKYSGVKTLWQLTKGGQI